MDIVTWFYFVAFIVIPFAAFVALEIFFYFKKKEKEKMNLAYEKDEKTHLSFSSDMWRKRGKGE